MHELSIAMSLLEVATDEAERRGGVEVIALHIRLGPLSGVVKEALISAWELACEGSPLAGSRIVVEEVPLVVHCPACDIDAPAEAPHRLRCSRCGTPTGEIVAGHELELFALEVEA